MRAALGLRWAWPRLDYALLAAIFLTTIIGLFTLYSATDGHWGSIYRQIVRFGIGLVVMLVLAQLSPKSLRAWTPWLYLVSVLLLFLVALLGEGRGAQRWLDLGVVRFQPSELLKLAVPMMIGWYLHRRHLPPGFKDVLVCLAIIAVPAGLIRMQPDLGTALLVGISGAFVIFLAGVSWRALSALGALALAASPVLWYFMHPYQRQRVLTFLNPEADPLGEGWNIIQSVIAVGSGGFTGKGWQAGTQAHLEFLPESSTDFILAVYSEEFGLVGVVALLAIYLYIVARCLSISVMARDTYSRLVAGSLGLTFAVYVTVNAGMISGMLPVVGVPLPLVSYGGTSIVSLMAAFGIIMSVFGHRKFLKSPQDRKR